VQTIKADQVWGGPSLGYDGGGVGVGIIDAGVDGTHPDLCAAAQFCKGTPIKTVQNVDVIGKEDSTGTDPVVFAPDQISTRPHFRPRLPRRRHRPPGGAARR